MNRARGGRSTQRATIRGIAEKAGVSLTTVSRALNDKPDVSPTTRARILAIVQESGFTPSSLARSLVTQRSFTIGLAVRTIADMWVVEVAPAIEEILRHAGYEVVLSIHYADAARERRVLETFHARHVDGIIVVSSALGDQALGLRAELGIPVVLISPLIATSHRHVVQTADMMGARTATEYLIRLGHRRIAHIGVPDWTLPGRDRLAGYRRALEDSGLPFDPSLVFLGDAHVTGGQEGAHLLLTRGQGTLVPADRRPTACFSFSDLVAVGAMRGARALGLRVPDDFSVIGFDDVSLARYVDPPLSTMRQDMVALGRRAAEMLLALIAGREVEAPVELPTVLVERASTAAPATEQGVIR